MEIKFNNILCYIEMAMYSNKILSLEAVGKTNNEPYIRITTNLVNEPCGEKQAFINLNGLGVKRYQALIDQKVISEKPLLFASSGYCKYPLHDILI